MTPVAELQESETKSSKIEKQAWQVRTGRSSIAPLAAQPLFADVLLEVDSAEKGRRKWAAISTILLQSLLLGAVLIAIDVYRGTANRVAVCNFLGCAATAAATAIGSSSSAEGDTASSERHFGRAAASTGQDPTKDRND